MDIRVDASFKGHRKRRKLKLLIGADSTDRLLDLWIATAQNHPTGILEDMDEIDIALEAGWDGDAGVFIKARKDCKLIDKRDDGTYELHDWEEHQPWVFHSKDRSMRARKAAATKWGQNSNNAKRSERLAEARKKGTHTAEEWEEMTEFFAQCLRCGSAQMVKDHIIPIYQGGSDGIQNLQPICGSCNSSKGAENIDYRVRHCEDNAIEMPIKWLQDAGISLSERTPPSPIPSPLPKEKDMGKKKDSYGTAKGRNLKGKHLETFLEFWNAFNLKKGKAHAADSWLNIQGLTPRMVRDIVKAAERTAAGRQEVISKGGTPQYAQGWLTGKRWEDEPPKVQEGRRLKTVDEVRKANRQN
ncbi:MAG: HNH endonuclease [Thermoplasmata archaeon]|nr:HNH endonuclease [Thermoplasmata archaeon]